MKKLINNIRVDFKFHQESKNFLKIILFPDFQSVLLYRVANFFARNKLGIIGKLFWYLNRILFAVDINEKANLASPFVLVHGIGIVIGAHVQSEGLLKIYQGV